MAGMLVECFIGGWKKRLAVTKTDSSGHFSFPNLPEGKYFVKASGRHLYTIRTVVTTTHKST
ncbi:MAG TPA: carboxypeptidase-like regulatory domain-containing protein, partial [Candidatus Acidoferrum sp.]